MESGFASDGMQERYVDLLKRSLCNLLYPENELRIMYLRACAAQERPASDRVLLDIRSNFPSKFEELLKCRQDGRRTECQFSKSMAGLARLNNLQRCATTVLREGIPGDFLEAGVWQGGNVILLRALLQAYGDGTRTVWAADSFEGLPKVSLEEDRGFDFFADDPFLAVSLETVQENLRVYGLLDARVRFLKGWFKDTLPNAPVERISILRLDGDLYESTMDTLVPLYDKVSPGGFIIVDDYGDMPPCRRAVDEFRSDRGITVPLQRVDYTGAFWRKDSKPAPR